MGKVFAIAGAAALALVVVGSALANHAWGSYHWSRASNPFTLQVGDNVSSGWDAYIINTGIRVTHIEFGGRAIVGYDAVCDGQNGNDCNGPDEGCRQRIGIDLLTDERSHRGPATAPMGTTVGSASRRLGDKAATSRQPRSTQATTKINDSYFGSAPYNTSAWKQMVMCQEVGHDFGLDHQDENFNNPNLGTCMDYTNDPSTNQHPNAHDYEELDIIYAHLDGSGGGGKPMQPAQAELPERRGGQRPALLAGEPRQRRPLHRRSAWRPPHHARLLGTARLERNRSRQREGPALPALRRVGSGKGP